MLPSSVVNLCRLLNPEVPGDKLPWIVMVGVYLDESEDDQTGVFTLAGWVASPTGWKDNTLAWRDMVQNAPHPITEFHMTDIAGRCGEFADDKGWTQEERDDLVIQATDIITNKKMSAGMTAFACSILRSEVDWRTPSSYELYKVCHIVLFTLIHQTFNAFRAFDWVFDSKEKVRGHVESHFWKAKAELDEDPQYRGMLKTVAFSDSASLEPLQMADFLAYERRKRNSDRVSGAVRHRRSYQRLCERDHHFRVIDKRFVTALMAEVERTGRHDNINAYRFIPVDDD